MGVWARSRYHGSAQIALASANNKVSGSASTAATLQHTLSGGSLSPPAGKRVRLERVEDEIALDGVLPAVTRTLTSEYTTQPSGGVESAKAEVGTSQVGDGTVTDCTGDAYSAEALNLSPAKEFATGKAVTVRLYLRVNDAGSVTAMCSRACAAKGRHVRQVSHLWQRHRRGVF